MRWRIESENAGSGMAFFRKFSIDLSNAALWGKHCKGRPPSPLVVTSRLDDGRLDEDEGGAESVSIGTGLFSGSCVTTGEWGDGGNPSILCTDSERCGRIT